MAVLAEQMAKKRVPTSDLRAYRDVMEGRRVAMMEISFSLFMSPATGLDEMIRLLPYFKPFEQKEVPPHFRRAVWPDTRREVAIVWLRALAAAQSELAGQRYPEVPSSIAGLPDREVAAAKKLMAQAEATRKRRGQLWPFVSNGLVYLQQLYATRPVDREELTDLARIFQVKLEAIPSVSHEDAPRQDKGTADPNQKTPPRP